MRCDTLVRLALAEPEPIPQGPWKGLFKVLFARGGNDSEVEIGCTLSLDSSLIEGKGSSPNFPWKAPPQDREFTLTGSRTGDQLAFDVWFGGAARTEPFRCEGVLNDAEDQITGNWSFSCFKPHLCDCGGGGGTFRMEKML